jgi:hypothetical protein
MVRGLLSEVPRKNSWQLHEPGSRNKDAIDAGSVLTEISGVLVRDSHAGRTRLARRPPPA